MTDLVVIVPSRGRPQAVAELAASFGATCTASTRLLFMVDIDDPDRPAYCRAVADSFGAIDVGIHTHMREDGTMVSALNDAAQLQLTINQPPFALGFMGDDHRPRTVGWDKRYLDALRELGTGIVYGDDLLQHEKLPTQCAMTSDIVAALGYMAPPSLTHMYVDNFWLGLGRSAGCLCYLPDVVVEHMHPLATNPDGSRKAEWSEGHRRVNDRSMYAKDEVAYLTYCSTRFADDIAKVAALRGAHV